MVIDFPGDSEDKDIKTNFLYHVDLNSSLFFIISFLNSINSIGATFCSVIATLIPSAGGFGSSIAFKTDKPIAHETGFPPNELKNPTPLL